MIDDDGNISPLIYRYEFLYGGDTLVGDITQDGTVNVLDVIQCVNFVLGIITPSEQQFATADVDNNGTLNVLDVISIVNLVLNE